MTKIRSAFGNGCLTCYAALTFCLALSWMTGGSVVRAQPPGDAKPKTDESAANQVEPPGMSDEERAIKTLESYGERVFVRDDSPIRVLQITQDKSAQQLRHFPNLGMVVLTGPMVTDDALQHLTELRSLSTISLRAVSITDDGLRQLSMCPTLRRLVLEDRVISESLVEAIGQIQGLQTLDLRSRIGAAELKPFEKLLKLPSLSLSEVVISQRSIDALNQLFQIGSVSLSVSQANDNDCALLANLTLPVTLTVGKSPAISRIGWASIGKSNLRAINVHRSNLDDEGLKALSASQSLTSLMILQASITDEGLTHLYGNKKLKSVTLQGTQVTRAGVEELIAALPDARVVHAEGANIVGRPAIGGGIAMPALPSVRFMAMPDATNKSAHLRGKIDDEVIKALKAEPALGSVFVMRGDPTDDDIAKLKDVAMTGLMFESDAITPQALGAFKGHRSIAQVTVISSKITDQTVDDVLALPELTKLSLHHAEITDTGMQRLIAGLAERDQVKWLEFSGCPNLTNDAFKGLDRLTGLQQLFLNDNPKLSSQVFGEVGKVATVREIRFGAAAVEPKDLELISGLTLDRLHFSGGKLSDETIAKIADAFPHLTQIGLADSDVSDDAMKSIAKLEKLEWIFIQGTNVSGVGLQHLEPLEKLKYVFASRRKIGPEAVKRFLEQHPGANLRLN